MTLYDVYEKIIGKLLELFPEKKASRIYHYTSKEVLWEFLKPDNDFYCTYFRDLSDPTEFQTGMNALTRMWRKHCGGDEEEFLRPIERAYAMSGKESRNLTPWVMSFSAARDKTSQWMSYTDSMVGGFSIGFNMVRIKQIIQNNTNQSYVAWSLITLLPCLYSGHDDQSKINAVLEFVLQEVACDLKNFMDKRQADKHNLEIARALLYLLMASIIKHSDFSSEEEWRLVMQPIELSELADRGLTGDKSAFAMIGSKMRLRSGLLGESNMISSLVEEIVVSPHGHSDVLYDRAQLFLTLRGLDATIVVASESPYRGATR